MTVGTVLLDRNVFTAWLKPRSTLVHLYGKHVFGRRVAIAQQTVAEARYGAIVAGWGQNALTRSSGSFGAPASSPWTTTPPGPPRGYGLNAAASDTHCIRNNTQLICGSQRRPFGGTCHSSRTMRCSSTAQGLTCAQNSVSRGSPPRQRLGCVLLRA